jgi:DegV family protein with EDD domain
MADRVAIVTDSACGLSGAEAAASGVLIAPLRVHLGGREYAESELTDGQLAKALRDGVPVTTSQPATEAFAAAYGRAAADGASEIVSIHLSGALSGTYELARREAQNSPLPVRVVDSASVGHGLGFAVRAGVVAAHAGGDGAAVLAALEACLRDTEVWFWVADLEHLHRGGRIGAAAALVGSALSVKPLLRLAEGRIVLAEKVRTTDRAAARLVELAVAHCGEDAAQLAVAHLDAPDRAEALAHRLQERVLGAGVPEVVEVGAAVGAHVGPGMLAVVARRLRSRPE